MFEGWAAYDLYLYLKALKNRANPWFTFDNINTKIDTFNYSVEDGQDKPKHLKKNGEKISGSACQVWSFKRFLPLLIFDKIQDPYDDVWKLVLFLGEIVLLVFAPSVKLVNLSYLRSIILDYLDLRYELFREVPLWPKHHYLHYPDLIEEFGPLIVWTLRFESKHKDLKAKAVAGGHFINILKTVSKKHEFFQSYLRAGASYRQKPGAKNIKVKF